MQDNGERHITKEERENEIKSYLSNCTEIEEYDTSRLIDNRTIYEFESKELNEYKKVLEHLFEVAEGYYVEGNDGSWSVPERVNSKDVIQEVFVACGHVLNKFD